MHSYLSRSRTKPVGDGTSPSQADQDEDVDLHLVFSAGSCAEAYELAWKKAAEVEGFPEQARLIAAVDGDATQYAPTAWIIELPAEAGPGLGRTEEPIITWEQSMPKMPRVGDLELEQDLAFQRREWRAERIGWVVMALLILAAFLGLFGGAGPLMSATVEGEGSIPLQVQYHRFGRFKAPSMLRLQVQPGAVVADTVRLWIDRTYLSGIQIDQITPMPESVEAGPEGLIYTFLLAHPGESAEITFSFTTQKIGLLSGRVGLATGSPLHFHQFIYP